MGKVSAVIITYNEENNLRQLLPLLFWCDEIIIVDSGSTDQTVEVCRAFNCKVHCRKFDGYGAQKSYALSLAENDWILALDADEILSNELITEIRDEMLNPTADAYYIPMVFVFVGKEFRYGKENWKYFVRLSIESVANFLAIECMSKSLSMVVAKNCQGIYTIIATAVSINTLRSSIGIRPSLQKLHTHEERKDPCWQLYSRCR